MSAHTNDTAQGKAATDALPSGRGRRRKLITALMILAFLAIIAIALYALSLIPGLLRRDLVVQTQEIEQITRTPPRIAVPMRVIAPKDLEARAHISSIMMLLEWARPDPPTIQHHIPTNHPHSILRAAPRPN